MEGGKEEIGVVGIGLGVEFQGSHKFKGTRA